MIRDVILSGIAATTIHGLILCFPLAGKTNQAPFSVPDPISLSIIHSAGPDAAPSQVAALLALSSEERPSERKAPVAAEKPPVIEKKTFFEGSYTKEDAFKAEKAHERVLATNNVHNSANEPGGREVESSVSIQEDTAKRGNPPGGMVWADEKTPGGPERTQVAHQGDPRGRDVVVYATPMYDENPAPAYPRVARKRGYEGETLLRVEVLETGKVGGIEIANSSGFEMLDRAALKSVKKWGFVPGTKNGKNIRQWVVVPVRFSLE